jgi:hypothetical protein
MGDTSGCQISSNNLAVYLQGVTVEPSSNLTSEYFVTASLPSSASLRRVWQFTTQGTITGPDTATLTLDYTQAHINCPEYNITFEGALNGTLTVKNQIFSANKFMSYTLTSAYVLVLTLRVPKSILECFGASTTQNYSFSVFVNDGATTTNSLSFSYQTNNSLTSVSLEGNSQYGGTCNWSESQQYYYSADTSGNPYISYDYNTQSEIIVYTGYLQIIGYSYEGISCSAPSTLTLNIDEFPDASGSFIALLGIEFDNILNSTTGIPTTLYVNWTTNTSGSFSLSQTLSISYVYSNSPFTGVILVYNSANASASPWSVQTSSADPFYLVTSCTQSATTTYDVYMYDAEGNYLYYSLANSSGEITIYNNSNFSNSTVYTSFPTSPVSGNFVNVYTSDEFFINLANPSTGFYDGSFFITPSLYTTVCYLTNTWQSSDNCPLPS